MIQTAGIVWWASQVSATLAFTRQEVTQLRKVVDAQAARSAAQDVAFIQLQTNLANLTGAIKEFKDEVRSSARSRPNVE
jgi:hypothetical protein